MQNTVTNVLHSHVIGISPCQHIVDREEPSNLPGAGFVVVCFGVVDCLGVVVRPVLVVLAFGVTVLEVAFGVLFFLAVEVFVVPWGVVGVLEAGCLVVPLTGAVVFPGVVPRPKINVKLVLRSRTMPSPAH